MNENKKIYEPVIGLEVHLQFNTATKIFCGCANEFGQEPNTRTCPVCLGLPGSLPVFNRQVLDSAIKVGLALHCTINPYIKFDRKNYYYPDLPKAYQISQYDNPVARQGYVAIPLPNGERKKVLIHRAHLEEDAGKLIHDPKGNCSLVDYNRTGTPLMEIVTEPNIFSSEEAYRYLQILKLTLQYLDVSDCDMEKGSLRCDANISLRKKGTTALGTKAEIKNMNSFKAVKAGLDYEINRQEQVLLAGEEIVQETRLWDEDKGVTLSMRGKEDAHDYRYFPEPDLVPFTVDQAVIDQIGLTLPEEPLAKQDRLIKEYGLQESEAPRLIQDKLLADFFEQCAKDYTEYKKIFNWINGALLQELNTRKTSFQNIHLPPAEFIRLLTLVDQAILSNLAAKDVLTFVLDTGKPVDEIVKTKNLAQVSDEETLRALVQEILEENEKAVRQIKEGKESAIGFLVGQAMRKTQGKANPKKIGELIKQLIK